MTRCRPPFPLARSSFVASGLVAVALVAVSVAAWSGSVLARRQPAPGGKVTLALPADLVEATVAAHTHAALVEPPSARDAASLTAHPPLKSAPGWRSGVLDDLVPEDDRRVWRLSPRNGMERAVAGSVARCFLDDDDNGTPWPAAVLRAAGVRVAMKTVGRDVLVAFDREVGPFAELLAGCLVHADGVASTGAYTKVPGTAMLTGRDDSPDGPPLIRDVELRPLGGHADLVAGSPQSPSAGTLLAPFPDVILLMQSTRARELDPLGLEAQAGVSGFRAGLGAELLLAVYGSGRGRPAEGILPPGIAPARPLPRSAPVEMSSPLALLSLPAQAPRVPVRIPPTDALLNGVVDRLAVLLRARGFGIDVVEHDGRPLVEGAELLRWRPDTTDPALALLALAGHRPSLRAALPVERFTDPRLLAADLETRLEGALALERAWIEAQVVVPLMTADRWFAIDPSLRGVKVRADGVPLLDDAHWGEQR